MRPVLYAGSPRRCQLRARAAACDASLHTAGFDHGGDALPVQPIIARLTVPTQLPSQHRRLMGQRHGHLRPRLRPRKIFHPHPTARARHPGADGRAASRAASAWRDHATPSLVEDHELLGTDGGKPRRARVVSLADQYAPACTGWSLPPRSRRGLSNAAVF